jgi:hypothetical protein
LNAELGKWERLTRAIAEVLRPLAQEP